MHIYYINSQYIVNKCELHWLLAAICNFAIIICGLCKFAIEPTNYRHG